MPFSLIIKQMCSGCLIGHQQAVLLARNSSQLIYKAEYFPMPPCVNIYQLDKFSQSSSDKQMSPVQLCDVWEEQVLASLGKGFVVGRLQGACLRLN